MLAKSKWLKVRKIKRVEIIVKGIDLLEKVRKSKVKNNEVVKAIKEINKQG